MARKHIGHAGGRVIGIIVGALAGKNGPERTVKRLAAVVCIGPVFI